MKKLVVVLSLAMAAFSFQASAATLDLGTINSSKDFGNTVSGSFVDTFTFFVPSNNGVGVSATNVGIKFNKQIWGLISDFSATLNGIALNLTSTAVSNGIFQTLFTSTSGSAAGSHTLVFTGTGNGSYGGAIAVAQTPIPAAIWLFGSALAGLTGMSRRKKA